MKRARNDVGSSVLDSSKQSTGKSQATPTKKWFRGTVDCRRVRCLTPALTDPQPEGKTVICLLQRDLRFQDNWALVFAQEAALSTKTSLHVVHLVVPNHTYQPTARHVLFHLKGIEEFSEELSHSHIGFHCIPVEASDDDASIREALKSIAIVISKLDPGILVCDFTPLRRPTELVAKVTHVCSGIGCPVYQVDAHNIVPVWLASNKQEYAARTFRPRVMGLLAEFSGEIPSVRKHPHTYGLGEVETFKLPNFVEKLKFNDLVCLPQQWFPGARAGLAALQDFCSERRLLEYQYRNNPVVSGQSGLSPWLHFGQLSAQRCLSSVTGLGPGTKIGAAAAAAREAFIEELVVRRELAENFTFYNAKYDEIAGASQWAQDTLDTHRNDKREYSYSLDQFESSATHDELWNAAQQQLVREAKMHGFLRMYWAKKILEWTRSPESALQIALQLNDKYSLDGTDPSGVVGCMWSIAGLHDQGWAERPVFGKIRFMNLAGCKRKFPVDDFVKRFPGPAWKPTTAKTRDKRTGRGKLPEP